MLNKPLLVPTLQGVRNGDGMEILNIEAEHSLFIDSALELAWTEALGHTSIMAEEPAVAAATTFFPSPHSTHPADLCTSSPLTQSSLL